MPGGITVPCHRSLHCTSNPAGKTYSNNGDIMLKYNGLIFNSELRTNVPHRRFSNQTAVTAPMLEMTTACDLDQYSDAIW